MKKRIFALLMAVSTVFLASGCGREDEVTFELDDFSISNLDKFENSASFDVTPYLDWIGLEDDKYDYVEIELSYEVRFERSWHEEARSESPTYSRYFGQRTESTATTSETATQSYSERSISLRRDIDEMDSSVQWRLEFYTDCQYTIIHFKNIEVSFNAEKEWNALTGYM